jgi:hypothetical protein
MGETIVVAGSLAQRPRQGGHTWVFLQYLLGFRRLGWNVIFLDRLEPDMCVDETGRRCAVDRSLNLAYFLDIMERFGLNGAFSLTYNHGERTFGLPRRQVLELVENSALLLNVMGFIDDEEILDRSPLRVFLDIDPGFPQMWQALGLADPLANHDAFVTIGENVGEPDCAIPTCGFAWTTTRQPVVLDQWPVAPPSGGQFTSVATWRGDTGPVAYGGATYGLRVHEFRRFAPLPVLSGRQFQLALDIHESEVSDRSLLDANGWSRVAPGDVAGDPDAYRSFIQGSKAELMVAKQMYVQTCSGWFSDRSICYLASGRPVLAQNTGFSRRYPIGEGLLAFSTLDEALSGIEAVERDYSAHARAAREIAESYFDSDRVLSRLLTKLGVG